MLGPFLLRDQYARAREEQADAIFKECLEIADRGRDNENESQARIQRDRLRVDTRKWMAGKLAPKKYGDRILTEQQQLDAQGNPVTPSFIVNVGPYPDMAAPETATSAKDARH